MSAWCLGVLNSHRKFFMSYAAPVGIQRRDDRDVAFLRAAPLAGCARDRPGVGMRGGRGAPDRRATAANAGPAAKIADRFRARSRPRLRAVFNNLVPVVASRGVGQISSYIDNLLASLLPIGAVAAFNYGQIFYMLPVSLFGILDCGGGIADDVAGDCAGRMMSRPRCGGGSISGCARSRFWWSPRRRHFSRSAT